MIELLLTLAIHTGRLTHIEQCVDFNCRTVSRPNTRCVVHSQLNPVHFGEYAGTAQAFGQSFDMQWFQYGYGGMGYHGQVGMRTLTLFFDPGLKSAYYSVYSDRRTYLKHTCKFRR